MTNDELLREVTEIKNVIAVLEERINALVSENEASNHNDNNPHIYEKIDLPKGQHLPSGILSREGFKIFRDLTLCSYNDLLQTRCIGSTGAKRLKILLNNLGLNLSERDFDITTYAPIGSFVMLLHDHDYYHKKGEILKVTDNSNSVDWRNKHGYCPRHKMPTLECTAKDDSVILCSPGEIYKVEGNKHGKC